MLEKEKCCKQQGPGGSKSPFYPQSLGWSRFQPLSERVTKIHHPKKRSQTCRIARVGSGAPGPIVGGGSLKSVTRVNSCNN